MSRFSAAIGLVLLPVCASAATPPPGSPAAVVDGLQTALIAAMHSQQSCAVRRQNLQAPVAKAFDFDLIAQKLLRRHWKDLGDDQRATLRAAIEDTAVTTYASQFVAPAGDTTHFELDAADPAAPPPEGRVSAHLLPTRGAPVPFDYTLQRGSEGWKIINVAAEGVSDLAVRSAQYESVIARSGVDGLITQLEQKNAQARAACGTGS